MSFVLRLKRARHRDRRRLVFSGVFLLYATIAAFGRLPSPLSWLPGEVFWLALVAVSVTVVAVFLPKFRFLFELFAISGAIFHTLGLAIPASNFNTGNPNGNLLSNFILFFILLGVVHFLTYGRWTDPYFRPKKTAYIARAKSTASVRTLWYGLMPTPGHLDECPDPDVVSIDYAQADQKSIRIITWLPGRKMGETQLHIHEMEPLKSVTLEIEIKQNGRRALLMPGVTTYEITDHGTYRSVFVRHEMTGLPRRLALRGWLDDTLGRFLDLRLRAVERSETMRLRGAGKSRRQTYNYGQLTVTNPQSARRKRYFWQTPPTISIDGPHESARTERVSAARLEAHRHMG
ncbi:MAG: hypothetical protein ACRBCL_10390 [Maritimibacter sp.]